MIKREYKFDKKSGELVEVTPERDKNIAIELAKDTKRIRDGLTPLGVQRSAKYPYESETMAVEPEDVPRAREIARAHGVFTEYTKTGEPIITSRSHQIAHMRAMGFYERNGTTSPRNR